MRVNVRRRSSSWRATTPQSEGRCVPCLQVYRTSAQTDRSLVSCSIRRDAPGPNATLKTPGLKTSLGSSKRTGSRSSPRVSARYAIIPFSRFKDRTRLMRLPPARGGVRVPPAARSVKLTPIPLLLVGADVFSSNLFAPFRGYPCLCLSVFGGSTEQDNLAEPVSRLQCKIFSKISLTVTIAISYQLRPIA
jgi:hypothetical protein